MNTSTQVVIFSSGEQKKAISQLASALKQYGAECTLWTNLFTRQNEEQKYALLPSLLKKIPTFDFAIILATPDELVMRERSGHTEKYKGMRDNVIFEIGLCVMALGCNKTIILQHEDVYLFDDLIGVSGIDSKNSLLSASALGVKCFTFSSGDNLDSLYADVAEYIKLEQEVFSPIVIGAACSTAVGYFNMYIKRMLLLLKDYEPQSRKELRILIPEYISGTILSDIREYYEENGFSRIVVPASEGRDIATYYRMEGEAMVFCDIPTSIGASYETAQEILSVDAADLIDENAEVRFLKKEANMFYLTLRKMLEMNVQDGIIPISIDILHV